MRANVEILSSKLLLCVQALLLSIIMPAQGLPALKDAPEITSGTLANGVKYYLVTNSVAKGLADVAIVRKSNDIVSARKELSSLPHFTDRLPYRFLSDKGVDYGHSGYIGSTPISTRFHFRNVPMIEKAVIDSTLMLSLDIIDGSQADQAIIISGDFDKGKILEEMKILSMTSSRRKGINTPYLYKWVSLDTLKCSRIDPANKEISSLAVQYVSKRTPPEYMNTMLPVITRMYSEELGSIICSRLTDELRTVDIPVAGVDFKYVSSAQTPGNETYTFAIHTDKGNTYDATSVLSSILAAVDQKGVSIDEYNEARRSYIASLTSAHRRLTTNDEYVTKCESAFLYGATLASEKSEAEFFASRDIADTTELRLFNSFAQALLSKTSNVSLQVAAPSEVRTDSIRNIFIKAWDKQVSDKTEYVYKVEKGDTLSLQRHPFRARVSNVKVEPISGGEIWTLSNGIRVMYKQTATSGSFSYAMLVRGGIDNVPGLSKGEGAFVSDMMGLCDVGGLTYYDFTKMLESNGISWNCSANLSDMRIIGNAPSSKLSLLIKSLISYANDRSVNPKSFKYYKSCESLRLEMEKGSSTYRQSVIDSIIHTDDLFSLGKLPSNLGDSLLVKADRYLDSQFSKSNDGVIVLIGDLNPKRVKSLLTKYAGWFSVAKDAIHRVYAQNSLSSGATTYTVNGQPHSMDIVMTAPMQYTADNYYAALISKLVVAHELVSALSESGMYVSVSGWFQLWPEDSYTLRISCEQADTNSLPATVSPEDAFAVLGKVRTVVNSLSDKYVPTSDLAQYKAFLTNIISNNASSTDFVVSNILTKSSEGKDLWTKSQEKVNAVGPEKVKEIISALNGGNKVEYVVQ
jgi:predicted Zn-dependent peptidase